MAGEWHDATLDQLGRIVTGKTPLSSRSEYFGGDIPFVTPTDFDGRRIIDRTGRSLTEHGADSIAGSRIPPGAVMVSCIGSDMGKAAIAGRDCVTNQQINTIVVTAPNDPLFVYYNLSTRKAEIRTAASGSAQPILNKTAFGQLDILLPSPPEQRAVAQILGRLDDKIELNRRMSETLEAMARALFRSWFVDFDPVRAKAEGRDSKLAPSIADFFPHTFVKTRFGEIPKDWKVAPLTQLIDVNPKRDLRKGVVAPYLDMAHMPTRGHSPDNVVTRACGSGSRFMNGDTLVARITPCLENGKTAFVDFLNAEEIGWGSTEYIVLRPKAPLPDEFAYCLARNTEFREFAIQSMTGSSGRQRVPVDSLSHFRLVAPPGPVAELFGRLIKPLFARASAAAEQNRTLEALRDTLLPKLIAGELRIPDSELSNSGS
jgi:type I restriction enzyme S subunit